MKEYEVVNGTSYHIDTPKLVIDVLEHVRHSGQRVRLFYGDTDTGASWCDEYDIIGTIGRSTGRVSIPLMIASRRSLGGPAILDHCIVKIIDVASKRVLYQHPKFHQPNYTIGEPPERIGNDVMAEYGYVEGVYADGENVANFKKHGQAERWVQFMTGHRMSK